MLKLIFNEDLLLLPLWMRKALSYHYYPLSSYLPIEIKNHVYVLEGFEVDVMVFLSAKRYKPVKFNTLFDVEVTEPKYSVIKRKIIFELKETDLVKALDQAVDRRRIADYIYVVLDLSTPSIMSWLRSNLDLLKYGVGVISAKDNTIVIPSYKTHLHEAEAYKPLLEIIGGVIDDQVRGF